MLMLLRVVTNKLIVYVEKSYSPIQNFVHIMCGATR